MTESNMIAVSHVELTDGETVEMRGYSESDMTGRWAIWNFDGNEVFRIPTHQIRRVVERMETAE